ncbi:Integrase core domain [Neisseria dentiae]|nr:hypothetical protein [Neisseria dentiae]STZ51235.1 Integrase core domain [Neisseria dentiae]
MKRLSKVERKIEKNSRKNQALQQVSSRQKVHVDTKRLPLLQNQKATNQRDYLFVVIDDLSCELCELYVAILPDRTAVSTAKFLLRDVVDCCPYTIEYVYPNNGVEYKGSANYPFGIACYVNNIGQKFTRAARPQTNGKAEWVIRTLMEM